MGFEPRRETALIESAGGHVFHYHDRLGAVRYQPLPIHQQKNTKGKEA